MNASIANIDLGQSSDSLKSVLTNYEQKINELPVGDATKAQMRGNVERRLSASTDQFRNKRKDDQGQTDRTNRLGFEADSRARNEEDRIRIAADRVEQKGFDADRRAREQKVYDQKQVELERRLDNEATKRADKPAVDNMNTRIADIDLGQSVESLKEVRTAMEERISGMDVEDTEKTQIHSNLDKRLGLSRDEGQANLEYTQTQNEITRNTNNRVATEQGTNKLLDIAANTKTPGAGRLQMQEYFQTDEGRKVPATVRSQLLAGVDAAWGAAQSMLPSQRAKVDVLDKSLSADVARVREDNPINENFAFTDGDRLTRGGAVEWARNEFNVDDSTLRKRTDTAIKALENEAGAKSNDVPWGIIAKMAYQSAAEEEYFDDSRDIEPEDLMVTMRTAFKEWVASSKNKAKVRTAEDDRDAQLDRMLATFKGVNEVRNQSKGK